ncbi:hypothetical protein [Variovorax atrisoli]|uniref:hypothetical protein n=1 Tax=Variovorax atrisoli TaxID=3394203 RepID=UPI0040401B3E
MTTAQQTPGPLAKPSKLVREGLRTINAEMSAYADVKASEDAEGRREARAVRAALAAIAKAQEAAS